MVDPQQRMYEEISETFYRSLVTLFSRLESRNKEDDLSCEYTSLREDYMRL